MRRAAEPAASVGFSGKIPLALSLLFPRALFVAMDERGDGNIAVCRSSGVCTRRVSIRHACK